MGNHHSSPRHHQQQQRNPESIGEPWSHSYPRQGQREWPQQQMHQVQPVPIAHGPPHHANQVAYDQFEQECVQYQQSKMAEQQLRFAR